MYLSHKFLCSQLVSMGLFFLNFYTSSPLKKHCIILGKYSSFSPFLWLFLRMENNFVVGGCLRLNLWNLWKDLQI